MPRLRPLLVAPLALAAGGLTATALAVPPGGPVENPLGATVTLAQTTVPATGAVTVSATGYDPSEHVSLKLDDGQVKDKANSDVLTTADAAADGTFTATVDLAKAATPLAGGTHNVRLLSSAAAGARSIHVDFTVPGSATTTTTPTTAGTTTSTTPTTPTTTTGTPVPAVAPSLASTALRASGGKVALRLRGGSAGLKGTASLRTTSGVTLARAVKATIPAKATKTVRLTLTAAGKAQVRRHARLTVVVKVTGTAAKTIKKILILKRAA
ncbi:hypothetical protein [Baekduia sp. Peel2402]|uniref:hypothetical protein n=1 Tax=Baekduia sp. Peel2402 TaxID=3458296 RepID=UPI00403E4AA2